MVVPRAIAEHVGIPEFHVPEAIRFGIVAEKRSEMAAPRAIWEHFRIPEFGLKFAFPCFFQRSVDLVEIY